MRRVPGTSAECISCVDFLTHAGPRLHSSGNPDRPIPIVPPGVALRADEQAPCEGVWMPGGRLVDAGERA